MTRTDERRRRGWIGTVVALLALVLGGFVCGALAGFLWEEPRLVVAYLSGETENLAWSDPAEAEEGGDAFPPAVAAAPPTAAPGVEAETDGTAPGPAPSPSASSEAERAEQAKQTQAPAATPELAPLRGFAVQVGAFGESRSAERLAARLRDSGFDTYVTPSAADDASRWRVRVGPVPEREAAERLAQRLKRDQQLPTWVLEESGG